MRGMILVGSAVVLIAGCTNGAADQDYAGSAAMDQAQAQSSLHIVRMTSADPVDAQFRDLVMLRDRTAVCGEIGTKNMLGYRSFKRFIVTMKAMHVDGQGDFSQTAWDRACRAKSNSTPFIENRANYPK